MRQVRSEEAARILIVEDDEDLAESINALLEDEGYETCLAHSGETALHALQEGRSPDVILVDLRLRQEDGVTLIGQFKPLAPDSLFVLMTAHATVESAIAALRQGAHEYLRKPFEPDELFVVMRRCVDRRRLEREAACAQERVRQLENQMMHLDRVSLMGEMATSIAHEINQPLTAISAYSQVARTFLSPEASLGEHDRTQFDTVLEKISQEANRAGEIVRRIRSFVKRGESEFLPEDLGEVVAETVTLMRPLAESQGAQLSLAVPEDPPLLLMDRVQIQQVVHNLVQNALDATRSQASPTVHVAVDALDNARVACTVSDNGTGIPEEKVADVLQRFVTTKQDGLGIGLSICQGILSSHGARLEHENNSTGGARFRFILRSEACP